MNIGGTQSDTGSRNRLPEIRRRRKPRVDPCTNCRERHLKCDDESAICRRCQGDGEICVRRKLNLKFRAGSSAKYDSSFSKDQTWAKTADRKSRLRYVDETGPLVAQFSEEPQDGSDVELPPLPSTTSHTRTSSWLSDPLPFESPPHRQTNGSEPRSAPLDFNFEIPQNETLLPEIAESPPPDNALLRAVLLRYFIDRLARSFDLCDPEKHFELVVPQRARSCKPLMNAILAASARHVMTVSGDESIFMLPSLPELNNQTAVHFHNECIKDLIELTSSPDEIHNENLLAAAIILRFHEEVDAPLRGDSEDSELFLRVTNMFITQQFPMTPHVPHSSPILNHSGLDLTPRSSSLPGNLRPPRPEGLRQAGFWVAFRQEIYTSFLKQRPFSIPLSHCEAFRSYTPAEDAVWADRMIVFCADVLLYCYGGVDQASQAESPGSQDHWKELTNTERLWSENMPVSFAPIYSKDPDKSIGEVLPEIWYLNDCHVTGVQHLELARILLAVHNPTRPRLGPGAVASTRALSRELKAIVLRLCGMALGNRKTPPALVTAFLSIALCGDHFEDRSEQEAMMGLLEELQGGHGWYVTDTMDTLKQAWDWAV